tara:strand:+ start:5003 stop:5266 length:264 start_codon:yes stop_codon:yes gene_type:complete
MMFGIKKRRGNTNPPPRFGRRGFNPISGSVITERRPKKLQGSASFESALQMEEENSFAKGGYMKYNKGGYASIQEMEKHCSSYNKGK